MVLQATIHTQIRNIVSLPEFVFLSELLASFSQAEVYMVGGTVRDLLLGRQAKDYDLVVSGLSLARLEKFLKNHGTVNVVGRRFGVLKFIPSAQKKSGQPLTLDIALPRLEFSMNLSGHIRDFSVQSDPDLPIEDDLSRRDFTINAIAYDVRNGRLVDPWGGLKDLEKKIIRAVGDPHTRFAEDYSRMLRALRFSCQLGFSLHPHTARALRERMPRLNDEMRAETLPKGKKSAKKTEMIRVVSYEVIAKEFLKSFDADSIRAFDLYDRFGVFAALMPELLAMKGCVQPKTWHAEGDVWKHTRLSLQACADKRFTQGFGKGKPSPLLIITVLLHDIGKPSCLKTPKKDATDRIRFDGHDRVGADIARAIAERLKLSSVEGIGLDPEVIHWLIKNHLLLLNSDIPRMKNTTLEKYFFRDPLLGDTLRQLFVVDALASLRKDGKTTLSAYRAFKRRLALFATTSNARMQKLPKPILDGNQIMALAKITPGPLVGSLQEALREEQLAGRAPTRKAAELFIRKAAKKKSV